ncbi:10862_t:CDS:2, partial [Cetraspora pellucida]
MELQPTNGSYDLSNKVVIITGATGGIGRSLTRMVSSYNPKRLVLPIRQVKLVIGFRSVSGVVPDTYTEIECDMFSIPTHDTECDLFSIPSQYTNGTDTECDLLPILSDLLPIPTPDN